jgi:hypothetical protein
MEKVLKIEFDEYTVLSAFLPAIINDDYTSLDDTEAVSLSEWMTGKEKLLQDVQWSHWCDLDADRDRFGVCEVTGLSGNVCDVAIVYRRKSRV